MLRVDDQPDEAPPGHDWGTVRVMDGDEVKQRYYYFDWAQKGAAILMARAYIAGRQSAAQEAR